MAQFQNCLLLSSCSFVITIYWCYMPLGSTHTALSKASRPDKVLTEGTQKLWMQEPDYILMTRKGSMARSTPVDSEMHFRVSQVTLLSTVEMCIFLLNHFKNTHVEAQSYVITYLWQRA